MKRHWFLGLAVVLAFGVAASIGSAGLGRDHVAFVYLSAFGFVVSTVIGALSLLAMTLVVEARWFVVLRGLCESIASVTLVLPVLFVPLLFYRSVLYPETELARAAAGRASPEQHAAVFGVAWMSPGLFLLRAGLYLALWIAFAEALRRASRDQARARASWLLRKRGAVSAAALVVLGLSGTWAAFDWLMSAIPGWNMTSTGLYVLTGGFTSGLGVLAVLVAQAQRAGVLPKSVGEWHGLALGRLLLASVCLWAYIAVSQLIIVWIADIPHEAAFYAPRAAGNYRYLAGMLIFGHFLVPFFLLLSRALKKRWGFVAALGGWLVLMHALDFYWLLAPGGGAHVSLFDLGPFCAMSALCAGVGLWRSSRVESVPVRDPELARSLGYESP